MVGHRPGAFARFSRVINGLLAKRKNQLHNFRASMLKPRFGKLKKTGEGVRYAMPDLSLLLEKPFIIIALRLFIAAPFWFVKILEKR